MMEETQLDWVSSFPPVLMYMRGRHHPTIGLSPHEVLTGRVMPMGQDLYMGTHTDQILVDEARVAHRRKLTHILSSISAQAKAALPSPLMMPIDILLHLITDVLFHLHLSILFFFFVLRDSVFVFCFVNIFLLSLTSEFVWAWLKNDKKVECESKLA